MTGRPSSSMRRRFKTSRGVAVVEAAVIMPLLLLITFAIVDFGSLFYVYLALENGVSQATRFAVTGNTMEDPNNPGTQLSRSGSIIEAMRQATPNLTLPDGDFTFQHMAPGAGGFTGGVGGADDIEKVTVTYTWTLLTPVLRPFFTNNEITFRVDSTMKNEPRFQ